MKALKIIVIKMVMMMIIMMIIMILIKQYSWSSLQSNRPSERAGELHMFSQKKRCEKKYNKNNFLAPDESRIPRDSDELMHERIKEQLNTLRVLCSWAKSA